MVSIYILFSNVHCFYSFLPESVIFWTEILQVVLLTHNLKWQHINSKPLQTYLEINRSWHLWWWWWHFVHSLSVLQFRNIFTEDAACPTEQKIPKKKKKKAPHKFFKKLFLSFQRILSFRSWVGNLKVYSSILLGKQAHYGNFVL